VDGLGEGALGDIRVSLLFSERCFYIIRASFSQERMTYIKEKSKVSYQSKDGKEEKVVDALEWVAVMCSHVPNKCESRPGSDFLGLVYWTLALCLWEVKY